MKRRRKPLMVVGEEGKSLCRLVVAILNLNLLWRPYPRSMTCGAHCEDADGSEPSDGHPTDGFVFFFFFLFCLAVGRLEGQVMYLGNIS